MMKDSVILFSFGNIYLKCKYINHFNTSVSMKIFQCYVKVSNPLLVHSFHITTPQIWASRMMKALPRTVCLSTNDVMGITIY